jgi:putative ABC transport system substrate-binding protein
MVQPVDLTDPGPGAATCGARRAAALLCAIGAAWPGLLLAQGVARPTRIAFLSAASAPRQGRFSAFAAIEEGLRARGHSDLQTQAWFADGQADRLPALAQQVLQWHPDLIVTNLTPSVVAMSRATRSVPIVMAGSGDPAAAGVVRSLSQPGGNATGVSAQGPELAAKSIELLRELQPSLRRMGVLAHATDPFTPSMLSALESAAGRLSLQLMVERVQEPAQYEAVFQGWERQRAEAMFLQPTLPQRPAIDLALRFGLSSVSFTRNFAEAGGLLAYAPDLRETARLVADQADRILRGTPPAQLPVQQNARFELLINRQTAAALRLAVPPGVLARATEVIE